MTPLLKLLGSRAMMLTVGTMGDSCCTMGLYTAFKDKKVMGLGSQTWFMLAFVYYLYFIMSVLSRTLEVLEEK
jgi:hypothetical protein